MMRLLQVSTVVPPVPDGIGDSAWKLHVLIQRMGGESWIATSTGQQERNGVYPVVEHWSWRAIRPLVRLARELRADAVLIHYPSPHFRRTPSVSLIPLGMRLGGVRVAVLAHEVVSFTLPGRVRLWTMLIGARNVLTSDTVNLQKLASWPLLRNRVRSVRLGATLHGVSGTPCEDTTQGRPGVRTAVYFGLVQIGKGLEHLLSAFENHPILRSSWRLRVAGGVSPLPKPEETELLRRLRTSAAVEHVGYVHEADLAPLFGDADAVVLPFPDGVTERRSSFMAAMALGALVVTTRPAIPLEGLRDRHNLFLLEDGTAEALAAVLSEIAGLEPARRERIRLEAATWYRLFAGEDRIVHALRELVT